jgi:hypothetical protein
MAIEDAYQLVLDLCKEADAVQAEASKGQPRDMDVEGVLSGYTGVRSTVLSTWAASCLLLTSPASCFLLALRWPPQPVSSLYMREQAPAIRLPQFPRLACTCLVPLSSLP